MASRTEVSEKTLPDFARGHPFLVATHDQEFGYNLCAANHMTTRQIANVVGTADGLSDTPGAGMLQAVGQIPLRNCAVNRTIYGFKSDDHTKRVIVEGIFPGGEIHIGKLMYRVVTEKKKGGT